MCARALAQWGGRACRLTAGAGTCDARRFYYEGDLNPFPDYTAEGSFSERQYTFKSGGGDSVGRRHADD